MREVAYMGKSYEMRKAKKKINKDVKKMASKGAFHLLKRPWICI